MKIRLIIALGLGVSACHATPADRPAELEEAPAPPAPVAEKKVEPVVPTAEESEAPSAAQLPVAEDFQVETAAAIVRGNYRSELDALEGELRAEGN